MRSACPSVLTRPRPIPVLATDSRVAVQHWRCGVTFAVPNSLRRRRKLTPFCRRHVRRKIEFGTACDELPMQSYTSNPTNMLSWRGMYLVHQQPLMQIGTMKRTVALALAYVLCSILPGHSQEAGAKVPIIGFLSPATAQTVRAPLLREALAKHGFVDGNNVRVDVRVAEGKLERLPELAGALVRDGATLIFATGDPAGLAAQAATKTLPIVMIGDDLVGSGLVDSLARPGGNITGVR